MRPRDTRFPRSEPAELPVGESLTTVYAYGTVLYDDMLAAIEGARERVLFESYIVKSDEVGQRFKAALIAAAERGVEVFVIYDGFANLVVRRSFFDFPPPVHVVRYPTFKPGMLLLDVRKSGRDHRKLLVVDGDDRLRRRLQRRQRLRHAVARHAPPGQRSLGVGARERVRRLLEPPPRARRSPPCPSTARRCGSRACACTATCPRS